MASKGARRTSRAGEEKRVCISDDFAAIFTQLKQVLKKYEKRCVVEKDSEHEYYLNFKQVALQNKPLFFAAVGIHEVSVSYYLMPIYCCPILRQEMSLKLRRHLSGKSCFRFRQPDPALFAELAALTKSGFELLRPQPR